MRVMHVESGRHLYGGAEQVRYLIEGLNAADVDNVLLCADGSRIAGAMAGTEVLTVPMSGDLDLGLVRRLRRAFAMRRPDLVHVHSRRGADLFGAIACAAERQPAVLTRRVDNREPAFWARLKYRPYRAVIAISRAIETELRERVGVERSRIHRVASAVDTQRFRPDAAARARVTAAFDLSEDALIIGVVAQLIERKGHATLFASLPELLRLHPAIRVLCFGRGPLEAALTAQLAAAGLTGRVKLVGFRDDLAQLLPGLDLLVHPAEREGLGVALLEALSCGVPVVACAIGGVVDVIEDQMHGLLVPPRDGPGMQRALQRLIADSAQRHRVAAAGRARVEQHFSVAQMVAAHLDIYRRVLGGTGDLGHVSTF